MKYKNRLRNAQKRLYFDLKIANFLQRLWASPPDPIASGKPHNLKRIENEALLRSATLNCERVLKVKQTVGF